MTDVFRLSRRLMFAAATGLGVVSAGAASVDTVWEAQKARAKTLMGL